MGVNLTRGGNVSLTEQAPGLTGIVTDADGRSISDQHFIFSNHKSSPEGAVQHSGDNLTGKEWKLRAIGQGDSAGLPGIAREFGVNV